MKKLLLVLAVSLAFFSASAQNKNDIEKYTSQKPQYGFMENKGQIHDQNYKANPDVKYLLCIGNGMNVQLKANGFSYDTYKTEVKEGVIDDSFNKMRPNNEPRKDITYYFHRVDVELVGANTNPEIVADEPSSDYLNYYKTVTPESGATFVRHYKKITYKEIYPGIDMVFVASAGEDKPVEYTFVVHPGADANQIKLHYIGANQTQLIDNKIKIDVAHGSFTESIPASWIEETNKNLNITYRALDKDIYSFEIPYYAPTQTLIIDPNPNLDWGTYYGGSGSDKGYGISCDLNGNVFVTGSTWSTSGIATSGAHQETLAYYDAFVVKFNSDGVRQWGTYFGGSLSDLAFGISCDAGGDVFVTGCTNSTTGIATSGAHQETFVSDIATFVVKFSSAGVRQWGTYYGGSEYEQGIGISCDADGNVFVNGITKSTTGIATSGAHQEIYAGGEYDAFVVKFNSAGGRQWCTYYGGSEEDEGISISCDESGNAFLAGNTKSATGIATIGAHQETYAGGEYDAFIVKFNNDGVRQWGTYYGGSLSDLAFGISCEADGDVFATGYTNSTTGIATTGAHQETFAGNDAFVVKFNADGVRQWGTYYGGNGGEQGYGIFCDSGGNVFVTGITGSTSEIATSGAYQETFAGYYDAFVLKLNSNGVCQWCTYYGGSGEEQGLGVTCDADGNVFVTGYTESSTGLASNDTHQDAYAGGEYDAFVARFSTCDIFPTNAGIISGPTSVCQSQNSVIFSVSLIDNASSYIWTLPSGAIGSSDTNIITVDFGESATSGNISVKGTNSCGDGEFSSLPITVNSVPSTPIITISGLVLQSDTADGNQWYDQNGIINGATNQNYTVNSDGDYYVIVTLTGCSSAPSNTISVIGTGIKIIESDKIIKVYPNPVSNELIIEIEGNNEIINFDIINAIGQVIFKGDLIEKTVVQTSVFAPGIYVVKLENGSTVEFKKIVKE
jgi:hypothetical protein